MSASGSVVTAQAPAPRIARRHRLGRSLIAHRRLRVGLVQLVYLAVAIALGALVPHISIGRTVPSSKAAELLVAAGAGFVPFIGIVYSLLFLVVQFGATTFSPRLSLFRDAPIVSHAFAFFVAVIAFSFTAAFAVPTGQTSVFVPIVLFAFVLVAVGLLRTLQGAAFRSIQLSAILKQVSDRGQVVIDGIYPEPVEEAADGGGAIVHAAPASIKGSAQASDVLWPGAMATLQTIHVLRLLDVAQAADAVIELCVHPGETLQHGTRIAVVSSGEKALAAEVIKSLRTGLERTFEQDPMFGLRVLADIALKALSEGVQDPTTAAQTLDATESLLRVLASRDLNVSAIDSPDGKARVVLKLPSWEQYLSVALDEIISVGTRSIQVRDRLRRLLGDLLVFAPAELRGPIRARLAIVLARDERIDNER